MTAYRKKPVVIEAVQWDGSWDSMEAIKENYPAMDVCASTLHPPSKTVRGWSIRTLEGSHVVSPGDWIIKGVKGEFYPCKDEIFRLTYEPAACPRVHAPQPEAAEPHPECPNAFVCAGRCGNRCAEVMQDEQRQEAAQVEASEVYDEVHAEQLQRIGSVLSIKGAERVTLSPKAKAFLERGADALNREVRKSQAEKTAAIAHVPLATPPAASRVAVPMTEAQITEAITSWFAEDWATSKARGLLADLGITEQKEGGHD